MTLSPSSWRRAKTALSSVEGRAANITSAGRVDFAGRIVECVPGGLDRFSGGLDPEASRDWPAG
jgi:hypothetical protein